MKLKTHFLIAWLLLSSLALAKITVVDIDDLPRLLAAEFKDSSRSSNSHFQAQTNSSTGSETYGRHLQGYAKRYLDEQNTDSSTEPIVDPLSEEPDSEPTTTTSSPPPPPTVTVTTENANEEPEPSPVVTTSTEPPTEPNPEDEPLPENAMFQYTPNSAKQKELWPALCETNYHGTNWGKSDETSSYFTLGGKAYLCPKYSRRDDLMRKPYDSEQRVSPCPQLIAEDSRGIKWAPVVVKTTLGEIPGKVRFFEDSGKTRTEGVFAYMGKSYRGPVQAWLC